MAVLEGNENNLPPREIHDNQGYEGKFFLIAENNFEKLFPTLNLKSFLSNF